MSDLYFKAYWFVQKAMTSRDADYWDVPLHKKVRAKGIYWWSLFISTAVLLLVNGNES